MRVEDVQGVLTLFCSGAAQVCHVLRVVELKEQLEVEEEDGDREEEEVEVESGGESRRVRHVDDHGWSVNAQNLSHEMCVRQSSPTVNKDACSLNACAPRDRRSSVRQRRHWCCAW